LDAVERIEPYRVHGDCLVLEQGPDALEAILDLRGRAYTGPLVAIGSASATSVLQAGADDLQPLEVHGVELLARLESVRRTSGPFVAGHVTVEPVARRVWLRQRELVDVDRRDVDLLACLIRRPGHPVDVTELARAVDGDSELEPTVVHRAVERLQRVLETDAAILEAPGARAYSLRFDMLQGSSPWPSWPKLS
jgi:DNA-binding response OmpR family regulator